MWKLERAGKPLSKCHLVDPVLHNYFSTSLFVVTMITFSGMWGDIQIMKVRSQQISAFCQVWESSAFFICGNLCQSVSACLFSCVSAWQQKCLSWAVKQGGNRFFFVIKNRRMSNKLMLQGSLRENGVYKRKLMQGNVKKKRRLTWLKF